MVSLSLRKLLYLIAVAPLLAFLWVTGVSVWDSYANYASLKEQLVVQRLANAGGLVAEVLASEAMAKPEVLAERRKVVDAAFADLLSIFEAWKSGGKSDPAIENAMSTISANHKLLPGFRQHVDAGAVVDKEAMQILQPTSAAGLELVRRSAATITDQELSRLIDGFHALMQVNDATLIQIRLGQKHLSGQPLDVNDFAFLMHSKGLLARYGQQMQEFLPAEIVGEFNRFEQGPGGQTIGRVREGLYVNASVAGDEKAVQEWTKASFEKVGMMGGLIARTRGILDAAAVEKLGALRISFLKGAITAAFVSLAVLALCLGVVRAISRMIMQIELRMRSLADGERESAIPFLTRHDEIGGMARSVEVFREAAIRNAELEAEAEENRKRAELERVEVQRLAEAEAEERLNKATGSLAAALRRLASGDLVCEIHEQFAPQFEALRHDFNTSVQQLRSVLVSVGVSAGAVSGGSGEISHASDDLAKRTEQQAASLEQTAAALEEITSNVTSTSRRTGEARDIVRNTRNRAEQSGVVVGNAVTAMERIEHASKQISQIIGVIDEIAFQTNLLALNAGVEAARAGEAGKGFAVVAQEVRELAQRSANAAKEIKSLIGNSEIAVSEGVKLVNETGDGLNAISGLVQAINEHMDAIAAAAQEQSVGLGEVNQAVNHMDQATQKNAAMVEEMNAASAGLAHEAASLAELLRQFRTEATGGRPQAQRAA
jgi:methyl-accepting chemotaxis protein